MEIIHQYLKVVIKFVFISDLVNIFFFKWLWPRGVVDISSWLFDNVTAE